MKVHSQNEKSSASKKVEESHVEMTEMVLPQHTNVCGNVFGGVLLSWIDIAAAICAQRHSGNVVVTASIDAMNFLAPIKLGSVISIKASVNFVARSSCEVGVKVVAENPLERTFHHTASAYLTMVCLDMQGKPSPMPALLPVTEAEKRRYEAAKERRRHRLELKERLLSQKS
ncbi:MAG: acyl-CoA thioesterase [Oligoflexales bacterium]|nr:acyl-CoA thioesterase [Oligoflexales bacterium]